ncbi:MAG: hypothetical protein ACRBCK_12635 [Alphaproteobacteria bacterium]
MNHNNEIRDLPKLPIVRDGYCSQEMIDTIVDHIVKNHRDLLLKVITEERPTRVGIHYQEYAILIGNIRKEAAVALPEHDIGFIDIAYELSRRVRVAYDMEEVPVSGKPLASSIEGPYPELISKSIGKYTEQAGFDQKTVDSILTEFYAANHEECYVRCEMYRCDQDLFAGYSPALRVMLPEAQKSEAHRLGTELALRLGAMCEL